MSRRRASQLFYVFIGARRRECLIAAQNEKKKGGGGCTHMSPMCSSNDKSARTEAYFRLCATHEYCYSLTYLPSYDPVKRGHEPRFPA